VVDDLPQSATPIKREKKGERVKNIGKNGVNAYVVYDPKLGKPKKRTTWTDTVHIEKEHRRYAKQGLTIIKGDNNGNIYERSGDDGLVQLQQTTTGRHEKQNETAVHKSEQDSKNVPRKRNKRMVGKKAKKRGR
jgi:hypothetical protein